MGLGDEEQSSTQYKPIERPNPQAKAEAGTSNPVDEAGNASGARGTDDYRREQGIKVTGNLSGLMRAGQ